MYQLMNKYFVCLFKSFLLFSLILCFMVPLFAKMDGILQWILSSDKESIFSLACSLTEEEKNIVAEMLFTCGLIPQTDRPSLTYLWNEAAQSNLTALYATLYALRILSEWYWFKWEGVKIKNVDQHTAKKTHHPKAGNSLGSLEIPAHKWLKDKNLIWVLIRKRNWFLEAIHDIHV